MHWRRAMQVTAYRRWTSRSSAAQNPKYSTCRKFTLHALQVTIYEEVDVKKLSRSERSQLVESALATQDVDNEPFFRRVRERIDR